MSIWATPNSLSSIRLMSLIYRPISKLILKSINFVIETVSHTLAIRICYQKISFRVKHLIFKEFSSKHAVVIHCHFSLSHNDGPLLV